MATYQTTRPDKWTVREWQDRRTHSPDPPPTAEAIREQLGWNLVPHNKDIDLQD